MQIVLLNGNSVQFKLYILVKAVNYRFGTYFCLRCNFEFADLSKF